MFFLAGIYQSEILLDLLRNESLNCIRSGLILLEMRELDRPDVFLFRKDGGSRDFRMAIPCRNFVGQEHIRHS
ncbi:hypothetical protein, partial [Akkermansia muciniphila]|uniref:hypothetical protein n=1 Tax=Akkermansia muciniphila TaxID=239935 RepID=UPI001C9DFB5F